MNFHKDNDFYFAKQGLVTNVIIFVKNRYNEQTIERVGEGFLLNRGILHNRVIL